jgi:type I restriction enzyme S subunit
MKGTTQDLPAGCRWMKLGEVCKINPSRPKGFSRPLDAPATFVPMAAVDDKTGTIANPGVVPYSKVVRDYTYFEENDVLLAKITPCMENGKHVIARNLIERIGFGTTEFHVLRPTNEILPEWICYFVRQPEFLHEAAAHFTRAVGQQRVPESLMSSYPIPLPPVEEQGRITTKIRGLLQEVDRAQAACESQLQIIDALPPAILRKAFKGDNKQDLSNSLARQEVQRRFACNCSEDSECHKDRSKSMQLHHCLQFIR